MPNYESEQNIIEQSLIELNFIISWINKQEEELDSPITILVGGWAVDAYNPWYGSIDIDLVTNNRTKRHLKYMLVDERGYQTLRTPLVNTVFKPTKYDQKIIIDFASRGYHTFEGRQEKLNMNIINENSIKRPIRDSVIATIPTRALLLLFKLKAAWDRKYRIENNTTNIIEYEKSKLVKDNADMIALLDPGKGGHEIDINFLGEKIEQFDFLRDVIINIPTNIDGIKMYGQMEKGQVEKTITELFSLIEKR